jgi:cobalamin biosynthesis Mg chelatase CobN
MHRPRHRFRSPALRVFSLLSVLVLLALASFPALADAEGPPPDYVSEVPNETHEKETPKQHASIGGGNKSGNDSSNGGGPTAQASSPEGGKQGSSSGNPSSGGGTGDSKGGGGGADQGQRNPGNGSSSKATPKLGEEQQVSQPNPSNDSGSSSPLVPILIAIAALAAISIGAVVYRQRRRGGDNGRFSPEAS